jgi:hypothetical protein
MQESVPVPVTGVSFDAVLAFLFAFIGFLFLGNLAYLLLRRVLDGTGLARDRQVDGGRPAVRHHHRRDLRERSLPPRL